VEISSNGLKNQLSASIISRLLAVNAINGLVPYILTIRSKKNVNDTVGICSEAVE
jgi:hypothetical protein